jgi:site-specific DNA recombinase
MRAALYIRVSTQEQLDGYSISAQKRQLTAYCESQGWEIAGYYVEEGVSAKNTNRPELQRMISHIKNGLIDCVLVYKLDRLTRSVMDLYKLLQLFEEYDCKFKSATEVYDTTSAIGRMFITLVASFAQFERERLAERVSMGLEQLTREGKWKGGAVGYGHDRKDGKFVIVEHEAEVVKDMYKWYMNGMSDIKIAIKLNNMGITTRSGAEWTDKKVRYVLTNVKNIGILRRGIRVNKDKSFDVENVYPPIIDKNTFYQAMALRKARNKCRGKQATSNYIFSGVTRCARCGSALKGVKSRGYKRYRCINKGLEKCDLPSFHESLMEKQFIKFLNNLSFDQQEIELEDINEKDQKRIKYIEKEINKIQKRQKKWQYAWANEIMGDDEFRERMREERERLDKYNQELKELKQIDTGSVSQEVMELLQNATYNWNSLSDIEKKQLLQILVDKIVVDVNKYKKPAERVIIKQIDFN